jgi:hypothetical protein
MIADKGYESKEIREFVSNKGVEPVIPYKKIQLLVIKICFGMSIN